MRCTVEVLTAGEKELLKEAAFAVLEEVGVKVHSGRYLQLLQERGAVVDCAAQTARLPRALVETAADRVNKVPAPGPEAALPLFVMGTEMKVIDYASRASRRGTVQDCLDHIVLGNALEHIDVVSTGVLPAAEVPVENAD